MNDEKWMAEALELARQAASEGEVPVGALIVFENEVVGRGYNKREQNQDPAAHAEMEAIAEASKKLSRWRLSGCTAYVTLEPCPMCAGALVNARVDRVVYGASDSKSGALASLMQIGSDERLNHQFDTVSGVLQEDCARVLKDFFKSLRSS